MNTKHKDLLKEAADPSTSLPRLRELSRLKGKDIRRRIRTLVAANPGIDEKLLWDLARDCDEQVLTSSLFRRLLLANVAWWERCGTTALVKLLARMGAETQEVARNFLLEQVAYDLAQLDPSHRGEITWIWEVEIDIVWNSASGASSRDKARKMEECSQQFQINLEVSPFPSFYTLTPGDLIETPSDLISLLNALISCSDDFVSNLEIYKGWQFELECSESSSRLCITSVSPNLEEWEFDVDNNHRLEVTDPTGHTHSIQLSTDNLEEYHQIHSIRERVLDRIFPRFEDSHALVDTIRRAFVLND